MDEEWEVLKRVVEFLDARKAEQLVSIDLRKAVGTADYLVIATGANKPHLKSLLDGLQVMFKESGHLDYSKAGVPESGWMILNIFGIMIHLFQDELRKYYDLEGLWRDAPPVDVGA